MPLQTSADGDSPTRERNGTPLKERENTREKITVGKRLMQPALRCLQGIVVGAGGILPGLSGGVLCVLFGVYQPMMELFAHPFQTWKKHLKWIIPFMIGVAIGFFLTALGLEAFFERHEQLATCTFIGLILGTMPDLFREGGKQGRGRAAWWVFGVGTAIFLAFFIGVSFLHSELSMNLFWSFFCGILWGVSIIVPGMSSSSILMNIGLYQEMNSAIANLDLRVLIPMGIGTVLLIVLCAHVVNMLFEKHYSIAFSVVIAAVLASTVATIPIRYTGVTEFVVDVIAIVLGAVVAYLLTVLMNRLAPKEAEAPAAQEE